MVLIADTSWLFYERNIHGVPKHLQEEAYALLEAAKRISDTGVEGILNAMFLPAFNLRMSLIRWVIAEKGLDFLLTINKSWHESHLAEPCHDGHSLLWSLLDKSRSYIGLFAGINAQSMQKALEGVGQDAINAVFAEEMLKSSIAWEALLIFSEACRDAGLSEKMQQDIGEAAIVHAERVASYSLLLGLFKLPPYASMKQIHHNVRIVAASIELKAKPPEPVSLADFQKMIEAA